MKKNLKQTKEASETKATCNCCKRSTDISISSSRVTRRGGHDHHHKKIGRIIICCRHVCMPENIKSDTVFEATDSGVADNPENEDNPEEEGSNPDADLNSGGQVIPVLL